MITDMRRKRRGWRLFWWLLVIGGLGAVAGYYYLHPEALPRWAAKTELGRELQTTRVYKWQDASGAWHVSDQPPPDGTPYQQESYTHETNVLPLPPELQD